MVVSASAPINPDIKKVRRRPGSSVTRQSVDIYVLPSGLRPALSSVLIVCDWILCATKSRCVLPHKAAVTAFLNAN